MNLLKIATKFNSLAARLDDPEGIAIPAQIRIKKENGILILSLELPLPDQIGLLSPEAELKQKEVKP